MKKVMVNPSPVAFTFTVIQPKVTVKKRWQNKMKSAIIEIGKIVGKQLLTEGVKKIFDSFFQLFRTNLRHEQKACQCLTVLLKHPLTANSPML